MCSSVAQWWCRQKGCSSIVSSETLQCHRRVWPQAVWPAVTASSSVTRKVVWLAWQPVTFVRSAGHRSAALWTGEKELMYTCYPKCVHWRTVAVQLKLLTWFTAILLFHVFLQRPVQVQWCAVSIGRWRRCGGPQHSPHQSLQTDGELSGQVAAGKFSIILWWLN